MSNNYSEKELYSTKVYKDALAFALKAHKNQKLQKTYHTLFIYVV